MFQFLLWSLSSDLFSLLGTAWEAPELLIFPKNVTPRLWYLRPCWQLGLCHHRGVCRRTGPAALGGLWPMSVPRIEAVTLKSAWCAVVAAVITV